jgi:hypothetical protein
MSTEPYGAGGSGLRAEGDNIVKAKRDMNDTKAVDEKAARLATALRENLKRRKAQSRGAADTPPKDVPSE